MKNSVCLPKCCRPVDIPSVNIKLSVVLTSKVQTRLFSYVLHFLYKFHQFFRLRKKKKYRGVGEGFLSQYWWKRNDKERIIAFYVGGSDSSTGKSPEFNDAVQVSVLWADTTMFSCRSSQLESRPCISTSTGPAIFDGLVSFMAERGGLAV